MKLYVLDDNGAVVFEMIMVAKREDIPQEEMIKRLLKAALESTQRKEK